ncbi:hypothetical protein D3C75_1018620 [compost metagenome]
MKLVIIVGGSCLLVCELYWLKDVPFRFVPTRVRASKLLRVSKSMMGETVYWYCLAVVGKPSLV